MDPFLEKGPKECPLAAEIITLRGTVLHKESSQLGGHRTKDKTTDGEEIGGRTKPSYGGRVSQEGRTPKTG